jgi:tetratricopeptide (TPR) repeat protein
MTTADVPAFIRKSILILFVILFFATPTQFCDANQETLSSKGTIISLIKDSKFDEALHLIDEIIQNEENRHEAIWFKAMVLAELGECESAIEWLFKLEKIGQIGPNLFILRGKCWIELEQYQLAKEDLNRAVEMDSNNSRAFYYRAICHEKSGAATLAIEDYQRSIDIEPAIAPYAKRILLLKKVDRIKEARSDLAAIIKLVSPDSFGYSDAALILHNLGNYEGAVSDYKKAIDLKPSNSLALSGLALLYATSEDINFRNGDKAIQLAQQALSLEKHHSNYSALAASYAELGNFREATETLNEAIELALKGQDTDSLTHYQEMMKKYNINKPWRGNPPISPDVWEIFFSCLDGQDI